MTPTKTDEATTTARPTPERLMKVGTAFWESKVLLSAVEIGVFTELAKKPATAEELQKSLKLHERGTRDFLDTLVSMGFLQREGKTYSNAADAEVFLDVAKPSYLGGFLEMLNGRLYGFWGNLTEALRTGSPQNEVKTGTNLFETLYANPELLRSFLQAMTGISRAVVRAIATEFPWKDYKTFADVGTAQGGLAVEVAKHNEHLTGIGYDLASVGPIFDEFVKENGLNDRLTFAPGNFFTDPLPSADVIVMGHILHDWNLEQKKMLVGKAFDALPKGGALIVYDAMIDDDRRENTFGLLMSLNMLIETPGGYDYTTGECDGWLREAGFTKTSFTPITPTHTMGVGIK
jgi:hypothetical protein